MTHIITAALDKLDQDPKNVRKTHNASSIAELAASIEANGLLQNLIVREGDKKGRFLVTGGGRRLKALKLLAEAGKIEKGFQVNCLLRENDEATEVSLAENVMREAMHPADQFEAYSILAAEGKSTADIAAKFGTTETMIRKRLALGCVSPVLLALFRDDEMSLDQLTAFTISDDHGEQERVWSALPPYNKSAHTIRHALTGEAISASDKRIGFIGGLSAYEAAGGAVKRDLFDEAGGGYALDAVLLETMVADAFQKIADKVKAEGWSWVEIMPRLDYDLIRTFDRHYPQPVDPTNSEQAELDRLTDEYEELAELIETGVADDDAEAKAEALQIRIDALNGAMQAYTIETMEAGGAIISLDYYGRVSIERGFIKPAVNDNQENDGEDATATSETKSAKPALTHSAALIEDLTAQKTAALRVELANNAQVALVAVVHAMLLQAVYKDRGTYSALQISMTQEQVGLKMKQADSNRALQEMSRLAENYGHDLPGDPADLWEWCRSRDVNQLLSLLAFAAAQSLNVVETKYSGGRMHAFAHGNQLAEAMHVTMHEWFEPTAENYFNNISRGGIEFVMNEAAGEQAALAIKATARKTEAAIVADRLVKGTGWLPEHIRIEALSLPFEATNAHELNSPDGVEGDRVTDCDNDGTLEGAAE